MFLKKTEKKFPAGFLLLGVLLGVLLGKVGWGGVQKSPKIVKKSIFFLNSQKVTPNVWGGKEPHFKSFAGL